MNPKNADKLVQSSSVSAALPTPTPPLRAASTALALEVPDVPDYEVLKRIGGGSYGEVWLVRSLLGTYRAVKVVYRRSFEHDQPFEREFKGIQRFEPISHSHDSQVKILHVGRNAEAAYFYYVMELADDADEVIEKVSERVSENGSASGSHSLTPSLTHSLKPDTYAPRTLKFDLQRRGRLPVDECIQIGLSLSTALAHLHGHGLIHRDVKPSNIIFVNGVPKLADIGLVTDVEATRSFVGTEGFIPPEGPGTVQADLYSLGKVLYEMSMGRSRLDFPALPANWDELRGDEQARLLEFNEVLVKACESDPRRRYQSAQQMAADLGLLQDLRSVRRKHVMGRRLAMVKKGGLLAAALTLLVASPSLFKVFTRGKHPSPEAVRLYDLGRFHYAQLTDESLNKAIEYLNQATRTEPEFVPAYVTLFEIYCWKVGGISDNERLARIKQIAAKLLTIAPKLAETRAAVSYVKFTDGDWRGAEDDMRQAIRLNPNYATAHGILGFYLVLQGRTDGARRELNLAQQLDPTSRIEATVAGYPFMADRDLDGAIAQFRKALRLDLNFPLAHLWIGKALQAKGDYLGAVAEFEKSALLAGDNEEMVKQQSQSLRQAYTEAGAHGYWRKALELQERFEAHPDTEHSSRVDRWSLAGIYAQLGDKEKALAVLEKDADASNWDLWLKVEPCYETLRDELRFKGILRKAGLEQ